MTRPTHRLLGLSLVGALAFTTSCSLDASSSTADLALAWSDEFDGAAGAPPDQDVWGYETFGDGSGNQELQCYTQAPGNVATDGAGHLVITALYQPGHECVDGYYNDYTSARITTQKSETFQYGRLEVRAKVPSGVGMWPAFWGLGENKPEVGWPRAGEIDAMEFVGQTPEQVKGSVHGPTSAGDRWYITREGNMGEDLSDDFHVYAVTWTAEGMTWTIDGETYGEVTKSEAEAQGEWVYDQPFYLLLNLAVGGSLGGPVASDTVFPQEYVVDYVRVYQ